MSNIRVVIDEGRGEGRAVCLCGRDFHWSVPYNDNILYQVGKDKQVDTMICCPRCHSTIKK